MLDIRIHNESLDLPPDTRLELEQENPFLQFGEQVKGEFSLPFSVQATPKNLRLLGFAGIMQQRITNTGIDAVVYDSGRQHSIGKIKIEKPMLDLNDVRQGTISCFYLTGSSSFYDEIKDVKLRTVNVGGIRTFPFTNFNRSGSAGFWQHLHQVIDAAPNAFDYTFYPVIDKSWQGEQAATEVLNNCGLHNGAVHFRTLTTDNKAPNVIIPFPYLKYVLEKTIAHTGWRLDAAGVLGDPDFMKATMLNFRALDWGVIDPKVIILGPARGAAYSGDVRAHANVSFNLQDHLPDITITEFLIWLKNRFGWWYEFDKISKTIRIKPLATTAISDIKDFSHYASPLLPKPIKAEKKGYALRNNFSGAYGDGSPNLKAVKYGGTKNGKGDLPAPAEALYAHCYLIVSENNYYICRQNDDDENFSWQLFAYNIYDYVPDGEVEDISTGATAVGSERYNDYLDLAPRIDNTGEWVGQSYSETNWGVHLAFYHGLRANKSGQMVPFASSGIYDSAGQQVSNWSLCYTCKKYDGSDVGLYEVFWKKFLATLQSMEEFEPTLYLPLREFLQLRFYDVISINNVRMYVRKMKPVLPFDGSVALECVRI